APDRAQQGPGRLPRRACRRAVQAGPLPLLTPTWLQGEVAGGSPRARRRHAPWAAAAAGREDGTMTTLTPAPRFRTAPFARRTWRAYGFLWLALPLAPFALAYAVLTTVLTVGLAATVVGLFVAGGLVLGARGWGGMYRRMARRFLDMEIADPAP